MRRLAANLDVVFNEREFLDRFEAEGLEPGRK
jgi:hydroxypyruvate isomerase